MNFNEDIMKKEEEKKEERERKKSGVHNKVYATCG